MARYMDEQGRVFTESEIELEYDMLKMTGDTEAETFEDYLTNCIDQDGTLTEL